MMDEASWLSCDVPGLMLDFFAASRATAFMARHSRLTGRKMRLFAAACCRAVWPLLTDERSRHAVEVAERFADGCATEEERSAAAMCAHDRYARDNWNHLKPPVYGQTMNALAAVTNAVWHDDQTRAALVQTHEAGMLKAQQAALLREIVDNPFRPLALPVCWWCLGDGQASHDEDYGKCNVCGGRGVALPKAVLMWNNGTIPRMAREVYDARDWDALPILADALEDSGCQDEAILRHLRGFERCWVCQGTKYTVDAAKVLEYFKKSIEDEEAQLYLAGVRAGMVDQGPCDCVTGWRPLRGSLCSHCGGKGSYRDVEPDMDTDDVVEHTCLACKGTGKGAAHVRGCHVLDLILGKE